MNDTPEIKQPVTPKVISAEAFLQGEHPFKPLQHSSDEVKAFLDSFTETNLSEKGKQAIAALRASFQDEAFCASHDAAHTALKSAQLNNAHPEAWAVDLLYDAVLPNHGYVDGLSDEALRACLEPVKTHLTTFEEHTKSFAALQPAQMQLRLGAELATNATPSAPAAEATIEAATKAPNRSLFSGGGSYIDYGHGSAGHDCSHHGCNHDHAPVSSAAPRTSSSSGGGGSYYSDYTGSPTGHICSEECHHAPLRSSRWTPRTASVLGALAVAGAGLVYWSRRAQAERTALRAAREPDSISLE